jgi:DNA-binding MarR family transcriptional regulator
MLHNHSCVLDETQLWLCNHGPVEPDLDLTTYVGIVAPALNELVIERLAAHGFAGVKVSHGYVVQRLLGAEPTISALATSLGMSQQGASKQVLDLERLGYAERVAVAGDQRARSVRLTDRGHAMVEATRAIRDDLERQIVERAGARRVGQAKQVLAALVDLLDLQGSVERRAVPPPHE